MTPPPSIQLGKQTQCHHPFSSLNQSLKQFCSVYLLNASHYFFSSWTHPGLSHHFLLSGCLQFSPNWSILTSFSKCHSNAILNPKRRCCEHAALNMPANLENSAVATRLEKVSFHSNPKEGQCQRKGIRFCQMFFSTSTKMSILFFLLTWWIALIYVCWTSLGPHGYFSHGHGG